ncbi:MAG: hypothetical protein WAN48_02710 [Actinomycetes bacterium]
MGSQSHGRIAAITAATGQPISTWKPKVNSQVKALALSPQQDMVYLGGTFKTVNTISRPLTAAVTAYSSAATAATLLPWSPAPTGSDTIDKGSLMPAIVNSLVVRPSDGQVYVGGVFTSIGGLARSDVAAVESASGGALGAASPSFDPNPSLHYVTLNVMLTRDGSTLFADGRGPGGFLRAYDSSSGSQLWARRFDGDVQAAVATDTVVYVGGHFQNVRLTGTSLNEFRNHLAAFDAATGETDGWNPSANSSYGVYAMAWSPQHVMAGGDFTKINFLPHSGLVQFSGGDTDPPTAVTDATATSTFKGRVDLTWSQSRDSDSSTVTYRVYRRPVGGSFSLIGSVSGPTGGSSPVTFSDAAASIGSDYEYQVRAADPVYLSPPGNIAGPVTVAGDQLAPDAPSGVAATSTVPGVADVSWTASGDVDDTSLTYTVVRHNGTNDVTVGTVVGPTTGTVSLSDSFASGGTVTYTVGADDGTSSSPWSDPSDPVTVAKDSASPSVPTGLAVSSPSTNQVSVSWNASTDSDTPQSALSYRVYRKSSGASGTGTLVGTTDSGVTSFTDTLANGILPDKGYTYYVAATDGPLSSAKTSGVTAVVKSAVFADSFDSLAGWTQPASSSGVSLDSSSGHSSAPSVGLTSSLTPLTYGFMHRDLGGSYPTVCMLEWVSVSAYDTRSIGQSSLLRVYSDTGNPIARLYVDYKGKLWMRSDWGSNSAVTKVIVPTDGSWHSAQLCVTTTPDAVSGTLSAWWDGVSLGTLTGVDNSPDALGSVDVGDTTPGSYAISVDDVSVGTTKR